MRFAKRIPALLLACGMLTGCSEAPAQEETAAIGELRPGDDFYGWCNAEALSARELPEDHQTSGTFADVEGMVDEQIGELISRSPRRTSRSRPAPMSSSYTICTILPSRMRMLRMTRCSLRRSLIMSQRHRA